MAARPLRYDATHLTKSAVKNINETRGTIPHAARVLAKRHKVSMSRIYKIWNGEETTHKIKTPPTWKEPRSGGSSKSPATTLRTTLRTTRKKASAAVRTKVSSPKKKTGGGTGRDDVTAAYDRLTHLLDEVG